MTCHQLAAIWRALWLLQ